MKIVSNALVAGLMLLAPFAESSAQSKLYPQLFDLQDVAINDGPFRHAQDLNCQVLLQYDLGRLMQPYENQAGLPESGEAFENWGGEYGLQGHIGGHYLSALSISYASCQDETVKAQLKERLDGFVNRLKDCQDAWNAKDIEVMQGYCGAVYKSQEVWTGVAVGDMTEYWKSWVPFYNLHKTYAGLRDAWVYAGNETAKDVFLAFCDWGVNVIASLSDDQVESLLGNEPGGINEVFADAYQMTGEAKYLTTAKRYAHKWLLNGMAADNTNILNNVHANTQVPKVVGFARTAQQDASATDYRAAARNFWTNVTGERTIAVGGNSIAEWFPNSTQYGNFITSIEGVETCNTNNMMKLTEDLFADSHEAPLADFFEQAMYNHILSSQHPETGGYVYFTPARPQHYRVYSQVNQAMWCCVGTGMENHGKYAEFAYVHDGDNLYVNLFLPTTLNWKEKGVRLTQETTFPYEPKTKITIDEGGTFTLNVRHPSWCEDFTVRVNGEIVQPTEADGFLPVSRTWTAGDVVEVSLPMQVTLQPLQYYTDYVAFKYGPILLGAKTGTDNLDGLFADDGRMGHIANGLQKNLYSAPLLIGDRDRLAEAVVPYDLSKLQFVLKNSASLHVENPVSGFSEGQALLEPFANIHGARYMMYWMNIDEDGWNDICDELQAKEDAAQELEARTLDYVVTGTQQSESDHYMQQTGSASGSFNGEYYRAGQEFSYLMQTKGQTDGVTLMVRYWGADGGARQFDILVDDVVIATEQLVSGSNEFIHVEYPISSSLLSTKTQVRVKFRAKADNTAGGVFYIRLLEKSADKDSASEGIRRTQVPLSALTWDDVDGWSNTGKSEYDSSTGVITWNSTSTGVGRGVTGVDYAVADYDRLIVKVRRSTCGNVRLRMDGNFDVTDNGWDCVYVDIPASNVPRTYTVNLPGSYATCNEGTTGSQFSKINRIWFNTLDAGNFAIEDIYFEKDMYDVIQSRATTATPTAVNLSMDWKVDGSADVTYDSSTKTITWAEGTGGTGLGQFGLNYQVSDYDRLVLKVASSTCGNVRLRMDGNFDVYNSGAWDCAYLDIPASNDARTFTIDLAGNYATCNQGTTGNKFSTIERMWFNTFNVGNLVIEDFYFEKDNAPVRYLVRRNGASNRYGTICLPFVALKPDNAKVYDVVGYSETAGVPSALYLEEVEELEAGKAYVFKSTNAKDITFTKTGTDDDLVTPAPATNLTGQFSGTAYVPVDSYILSGGLWKRVVNENSNPVSNYRAYLTLTDALKVSAASAKEREWIALDMESGQLTAIESISDEQPEITDAAVYDLSGRRISAPATSQRGMYILNGKKVMVK